MSFAATAIEAARKALAEAGGAGASVAGRYRGETFSAGIGFRDLARAEPYETDAPVWIYSITKPLIAALIMRGVEAGRFTLDDPASKHLPTPALDPAITLRRLLNHSSGLTDYGDLPAYHEAVRVGGPPWADEEFFARTIGARPPRFAPGESFAYSNIGYVILRQILTRAHNKPLATLLRDELFNPLGCASAQLAETLEDVRRLPPGWSNGEDISQRYHPGWVSHRAVIASANDVATLLDAILDARAIAPASRDAMLQSFARVPGAFPPYSEPTYGLGLMIDQGGLGAYGKAMGHGGGGPGFSAAAFRLENVASAPATLVALTNSDAKDFGLITIAAMAEALAKA